MRPSNAGYAVLVPGKDRPGGPALPLPGLQEEALGRQGWSCWKALPRAVPLVLTVSGATGAKARMRGLQVPLTGPAGRRAWLAAGLVSCPVQVEDGTGSGHWQLGWQLPLGIGGEMASAILLLGLQGLMEVLSQPGQGRPFLVRLDLAGLGLARSGIRRLEQMLSRELQRYCRVTGHGALLLGEQGFVQEYADASVVLQPGRAARMDLILPPRRRAPVFMDLHQAAVSGACGPLGLSLQAQSGERLELSTGGAEEESCGEIRAVNGGRAAMIAPDPRGSGWMQRLDHAIGFAPTARMSTYYGRNIAEPGEWNLTVRNLGLSTTRLTFNLDNAMPLLPDWQMPHASLQLSRAQDWDAEMLDYVRPEFFGIRSRFEALVQRGDHVPPLVLRRFAEVGQWPVASVLLGGRIEYLPVLGARARRMYPASDGRRVLAEAPAPGAVPEPQSDRLIGLCLDILAETSPDNVAARLAARLAGQS
ncbi:hypothetical protein [Poseidonocella sp. HB161398]|uniref:hypothetical protein n=1 Tax=Poseidonocella sp. HB161398 TaxID=2320855 RepID=UPI001107CAB5|nr:hypothetical protein [Poseidonocella sp. HB161398]